MRSPSPGAACAALATLALALLAPACRSTAERTAFVTRHDGGVATLELRGLPALPVPEAELPPPPRPIVVARDEAGARLAYPVVGEPGGPIVGARVVHVVDGVLRRGGVVQGFSVDAPDFARAPSGDAALADVVRVSGPAAFADLLARAKDPGARERLVAAAPDGSGDAWDAAFEALDEPGRARVRATLLRAIEPTGSPETLARVARHVPIDAPLAPRIAERLKVLASRPEPPAPGAQAALLRALAASDAGRAEAPTVACVALEARPLARAGESMSPEAFAAFDAPGRTALVAAALVTLAEAKTPCAAVAPMLEADPCLPELRCAKPGTPVGPGDASRQDEPLCGADDADRLVAAWAAAAAPAAPLPLLALVAATRAGAVPDAVTAAHARRRYALAAPSGPECEAAPLGAGCRCDEAILRDQACRHGAGAVRVGACGFVVDERARALRDVRAVAPP